ncbi:MAG: hypothetical protein QMC95_15190, partial [Desulfitobacteriaceae bacterium]|nr:hypothetical protein [Desulfitobacteriaceae bacterium]
MIEEFKFDYEEVRGITSMTLTKRDILYFHEQLLELLGPQKPKSRYTIVTNFERVSVINPENIDFIKFRNPIRALIIEYSVQRVIEIEIYLSTYEKSIEIESFRSHYRINCNDEALILKISNFLNSFFTKKKNFHSDRKST